jgi:hypothetical protein
MLVREWTSFPVKDRAMSSWNKLPMATAAMVTSIKNFILSSSTTHRHSLGRKS